VTVPVAGVAMAVGLALMLSAGAARAEPLPASPILRIDTGRHTAFIHALALDESQGRLYSASEDKTVRVWRLTDGRLLDTFRVPVGLGSDGQLFALALSPDGKTLAVGGWTCWESEGRACIYLLDAQSGEIRSRVRGLPEVIASLRFSPDGAHLAVGLMGQGGLRVYRAADASLVASDAAYRDKLLELDFTPDGRLVTAALDGFLRLYDQRFAMTARVNTALAGQQPFGLRVSPDGRFIAVGFNDVAQLSVLSASDLRSIRTLTLPGAATPRNLTRVAWSPDASVLYATGEPRPGQSATVFRWRVAGSALADGTFATQGRIGDLVVTRDQFVAFASDEPSLGLLDPSGKVRYRLLSGIPDYRDGSATLRVSADGTEVEVSLTSRGMDLRRFSVVRGTFARRPAPSPDLAPPTTRATRWRITDWGKPGGPRVNGHPLALEPYETPRAFSIATAAATVLVGTEWSLRAVSESGAARWTVRTPTAVHAVNSSADGRFAVAALADGTVNWYSLADGSPVLSLFLHADGESWTVWTPSGYYASSPYGDMYVGWQINRGADHSPDFFRAVQFERELYRPDVISTHLAKTAAAPVVSAIAEQPLLAASPPRVTVNVLAAAPGATAGTRRIRVTAESAGLPMRDVAVYLNDIPITRSRERMLQPTETSRFAREIDLPLNRPENELRVEVFNGRSMGVSEKILPGPPVAAETRGDLYVVAVGANVFPALDRSLYLSYASRDAQEFARALTSGAGAFRKVHVQTLNDTGALATRAAVLAALEQLKQATGLDTVVVFLASHGVSDGAGNYFFVPRDVTKADVDAIVNGQTLERESSLIGWRSFFEALRTTAGKRLLIVDTCQARSISGRVPEFSLMKRSASSHIAFILASKSDEESQEYPPARHGLFTYALLQGLSGPADVDRDGRITLVEWFRFASGSVESLRDRRIGPQTPQLMAPLALQSLALPRTP
jgi:WD40 repeat protein